MMLTESGLSIASRMRHFKGLVRQTGGCKTTSAVTCGAFRLDRMLVKYHGAFQVIRDPVSPFAKRKAVQVRIRPTHHDLQRAVQTRQRRIPFHQEPVPDEGLDVTKLYAQ